MRIIYIILLLLFSLQLYADNGQVVILTKKGGIHSGIPFVPADMPTLVNYDEEAEEIVIEAEGYSSYYYVEIVSDDTGLLMLDETISGTGGTIDVSSLSADYYILTIITSNNNVFEGHFTID